MSAKPVMIEAPLPNGRRAIETFAYLRQRTHGAHTALETALDLLRPPMAEPRFRAALSRFYGLHAVWEAAVERQAALAPLMRTRGRLADLRHDLGGLGLSREAIEALPLCTDAAALTAEPLAAWGSVYVMEGSTLGGKLIARALQDEPWARAAGLRYFDGRGAATGPMWRELGHAMDLAIATEQREAVAEGAISAFELIGRWVAPATP